jgi:hypothetical protein
MAMNHVDDVVKIHETSWGKDEISVKLGHEYLVMFYRNIIQLEDSFGFVFIVDNKVVGYATGFYEYERFNALLKKENLFFLMITVVKKIVVGKMKLGDLINLFKDDVKLAKAKYPKYHLGALALATKYKNTQLGKQAITSTIGAVLDELKNKGFPGCWGLCDLLNVPMRKYLLKVGFEEVDIIKMVGRQVVLYEKPFDNKAIFQGL